MNLQKEKLVPLLEMMGYTTIAGTGVWKKQHEDSTKQIFWGVDFRKNEVFKWVEDHREYDVKGDSTFEELMILVKGQCGEVESPSNEQKFADDFSSEEISNNTIILDLIETYVGNDVLEVFGDTGTGKSKLALHVAQEAIAAGRKVHYLDTERNLNEDDLKELKGCEYKYTPKLDEIDKYVRNLPKGDVVIIDSIGFPILTSFARLGVKQKGDALQKLIAIFGDLKVWAYDNNGFVLVTNQPESEFNKEPGHIFRPFGDKAQFAAKEIWKTEYVKRSDKETKSRIIAFRSRSAGYQTKIADMSITDSGVEVIA